MSAVIPPPDIIKDPDRGWRTWFLPEIYVPGGSGRYVPNVDDLVIDYTNGYFRVISVDYTTGISIRQPWTLPINSNPDNEDQLVGSGPGYQSESFRVFLNTAVQPHTLTCDKRLHMYGSEVQYIKIFRGRDISSAGVVISAFYDQSGQFLGENIPMELVQQPDVHNLAIKAPKVGYTSYELPDNEVVTAVAYSPTAGAVSISRMLILNSSFVRSSEDSLKYIVGIAVESPFLSPSDPQMLQFPINMPVLNLNLMGRVTYSDGSSKLLPVDGTKFTMHGLNEYVATVASQTVPLILSYALTPDEEYSFMVNPSINDHISVEYKGRTTVMDGAYSIKLFCTPVWIDVLNGYRLEWHLYNLLRDEWYNVTNKVSLSTDSVVFDPLLYGTVQRLNVAVQLNEVDPRFAIYRHTQTIQVVLKAQGSDQTQDNWNIIYTPGQVPAYGTGIKALAHLVNVNNWQVDITCGATTKQEWLDKVYYPTQPLIDPEAETVPPVPNFLLIRSGTHEVEVSVDDWNQPLALHEAPAEGKPLYLHFMRRNASTDLQLAVGGLITHRV